jgi:hypothetical protein
MDLAIRIFQSFEPWLCENWQALYRDSGSIYNHSYEWSSTWFSHFGKGKELFIISGWTGDRLELVAPLYRKGGKLYAIGSKPDFLDRFCILCSRSEAAFSFIDFVLENKLELDLRLIYPECEFCRYLLRRLDQEYTYKKDIYCYMVKPLIVKNEELQTSLRRKYKKLRRKEKLAQNYYGDELEYEPLAKKNERYIDEFVEFHQRKWKTFISPETRNFVRDIYLNNDFAILSRLYLKNSDRSVAYSFKYLSPSKVLHNNMFSFDDRYSPMSPGLLVPYYDLMSDAYGDITYIDYGAGSYEYKYYFANEEEIALGVKAVLYWKRYRQTRLLLKSLKEKLSFLPSYSGKAKAG